MTAAAGRSVATGRRDDVDGVGLHRVTLQRVAGPDPARAFTALAAAADPVWLWWTPDGDAVLGAGAAAEIGGDDVITCGTADGRRLAGPVLGAGTETARFAAVEELRRGVDDGVDGGPLHWFAAFSFAPGAAMAGPWRAFRRNDLVAPLLECRLRPDGDWGITATVPDDTTPADARDAAGHLLAAMTRPTPSSEVRATGAVVRTGRDDTTAWRHAVDTALGHIGAGDADKLVLARTMSLRAARPFDLAAALTRLRERQPSAYVFAVARDGDVFLGASPELLVRSDGVAVESVPLAGTTRAADDPGVLTTDPKSRHEHGLLADAVRDALAPHCTSIDADETPSERTFGPVTHLATRVHGRLAASVPTTTLLAALHPTPAVGAAPRSAVTLLHAIDGVERGLYAGAVGTVCGDTGEFAVALRCAVVAGSEATLYAGAGIVRGSDPAAELAETDDKFSTMFDALDSVDASERTDARGEPA